MFSMGMPPKYPSKALGFIAAWVLCTTVSLSFLWEPEKTAPDFDELYWVGSTYYYQLAFVQRDWSHPHWGLLPARENPPVAKYIIGLGLAVAGQPITSIDPLSYFYAYWQNKPGAWGHGAYIDKRAQVVAAATPGFHQGFRESGRIPLTHGETLAARRVVLACAVVASLLLLLLGALVAGWPGALLASQLLLLHPIAVSIYNHAMADAVALLFSVAAALAAYGWFRRIAVVPCPGAPAALPLALSTGALLGLACGAKMNSLVLVLLAGVLVAVTGIRAWLHRDHGGWRALAHGAVILVFGLAVFVAINPAIIRDPVNGLAATVLEHRSTELTQAEFLGGHLTSWTAKLNAVVALAFLGWIPFCGVAGLILWGAVRRWRDDRFGFIAAWWLIAFVSVTAWIPFSWSRYALPLLPPTVLLLGYAVNLAIGSARGVASRVR